MKHYNYIIIGGGIAGTTAAETIRKRDSDGLILIIEKEPYRLYSRVLLSKEQFFSKDLDYEKVFLKHEKWYDENRIDLMKRCEVVALDTARKVITFRKLQVAKCKSVPDRTHSGLELQATYDKLLIAAGCESRRLSIPGSELSGIHYLRTLDDVLGIRLGLADLNEIIVIGGGFVSLEICNVLQRLGKSVTLILRGSWMWHRVFDEFGGKIIHEAMERNGVKILCNTEVEDIKLKVNLPHRQAGSKKNVILSDSEGSSMRNQVISVSTRRFFAKAQNDKKKNSTFDIRHSIIEADSIIVGIGVECTQDWIKNAGIESGSGILANKFLETNIENIWAAGDCAEFQDEILGGQVQLWNWANAKKQGEIVGLNMCGDRKKFQMISSFICSVFGLSFAFLGDIHRKGAKILSRNSKEQKSSIRFFVDRGKLVGAGILNAVSELSVLKEIIEKQIALYSREKDLENPKFDLKKLVS